MCEVCVTIITVKPAGGKQILLSHKVNKQQTTSLTVDTTITLQVIRFLLLHICDCYSANKQ